MSRMRDNGGACADCRFCQLLATYADEHYPAIQPIVRARLCYRPGPVTLLTWAVPASSLAVCGGAARAPADAGRALPRRAQAIFQCLQGLPEGGMRRIILTASGGAFRDWPVERLAEVTAADAVKHPNWRCAELQIV